MLERSESRGNYGGITITVTYVDGPSDARVISGIGFCCVQSYVRPVCAVLDLRWP